MPHTEKTMPARTAVAVAVAWVPHVVAMFGDDAHMQIVTLFAALFLTALVLWSHSTALKAFRTRKPKV